MKVLLVTALVAGGVGRHVRQLARGLSERGHVVTVACPAEVAERFRLAETGASVVEVEIGAGPSLRWPHEQVRQLRDLMPDVDVVHAHGMRAGAVACLARRGGHPPVLVTLHNAAPPGSAGLVYAGLEQIVARRADCVLGVSPDLVDRGQELRCRALDLAVVPADDARALSEQERATARTALRHELGLAADDDRTQVVICVGRLGTQKRMDVLIDAYRLLLARRAGDPTPDPVLLIVGDGPEQAALEAQVAEGPGDVRLLGYREDAAALIAGSDLAVSASLWEGQPLFLQEALAAGVPVVATDVGGSSVVLGQAGLLVSGAEEVVVEELGYGMAQVLGSRDRAADLAHRSLQRAAELPSVDDAVDAVLAVYGHSVRQAVG